MLNGHELCVIIKVPLQTPLKTVAAVRTYPLPSINNHTLLTPTIVPPYFLHLAGSFYATVSETTFRKCLEDGICHGPYPPQYAGTEVDCAMAQYFHGKGPSCSYRPHEDKRSMLFFGDTLFYSILVPVKVKMICNEAHKDITATILGRGTLKTPPGCIMQSNAAIFPNPKPDRIFHLTNTMKRENFTVTGMIPESERIAFPRLGLSDNPRKATATHNTLGNYLLSFLVSATVICLSLALVLALFCFLDRRERHTAV